MMTSRRWSTGVFTNWRRPPSSQGRLISCCVSWLKPANLEAMRCPYSATGKPLLPLQLTLGASTVSALGLVDSGADVNVLPRRVGAALGAQWDDRRATLRLGGALAGLAAQPLLVMAKIGEFAPVRLGFAWAPTEEVPLVLGQTNFFMEFDVIFSRSRLEFVVVAKGAASLKP